MPAGAVCPCGELTTRPSRKCEPCETEQAEKRRLRNRVYNDPRWKACKALVFLRDRWRCVLCGHHDESNRGGSLDCHHRRRVLEIVAAGGDPFDPAACETRCHRCHGGTR